MVLLFFAFVLVHSTPVNAAIGINKQINFQGKLVNPDGTNVTDGSYSIVFTIYDAASAGTNLWTETQSVTLANGIFQVNLGSVTTLPASVDFNTDNLYLGVKVGADAEMTPRIRFTSVPQAFNSEKLGGLDKTGFIQNQTGSQQTAGFNINGGGTFGGTVTTPTLQAGASTALTITGNAASTWSTSAGNLTIQAGSGTISLGSTTTLSSTGALTISSGTSTNALTLDSGGTGNINIGTNNNGKTIQIGNTANAVTQTINIGNNTTASSSSTVVIGSTVAGSTTIQNSATINLYAGTVVGNATTQNLFNTIATTLNIGGAATTMSIGPGAATAATLNFVGGSGATGCTMTGLTGALTCSGTIDGNALSVAGNLVLTMPSNNPERGPYNPIWNTIGSTKPLYFDEEFATTSNSVAVYNNSGGSAVTVTRETAQVGVPNSTGNWLKVSYDGVNPTSPGYGGVILAINPAANKTYAQRFRAKIPVGKTVVLAENAQGTNNTSYWLTNTAGTGKWEDYIRISHAGNTGTFSGGGHIYITGGSGAFDWYISSINVFEVNVPLYASANTWLSTQTFSAAGNGLTVTNNANVGGNISIAGTTVITSARVLQNITGYTQTSGNATFNQNAADQLRVVSAQAPTVDMVQITNSGFPTVTDGVNGQQIDYFAVLANAAHQSSAQRINITNTSATAGSVTNGIRIVATGAVAGTTNGLKIDNFTSGAGGASALYLGSGWKDLLSYNGAQLISGTGILQSAAVSGTYGNLTGTGALAAGSIASGFGTILTANTITGTTLNGTTGVNTGAGSGTQRIDSTGNLVNITTANDDVTFTGFVTNDSGTLKYRTLAQTRDDLRTSSGINSSSTSVAVTAANWYRIGSSTSSAGRFSAKVTLTTTGGNYAPNSRTFLVQKDYTSLATISLLSQNGSSNFGDIRVVDDTVLGYTYIDVRAAATVAASTVNVTIEPMETSYVAPATVAFTNVTSLGANEVVRTTLDISSNTYFGISSNVAGGDNLFRIQGSGISTTALSVTNNASVGGTLAVTGAVTGGTYNLQTISSAASFTGTVNAVTGYKVNGSAAVGNYLRGDGTNFVSSAIQATDLPSGSANYIQAQASTPGSAQNTNFNLGTGIGIAATYNATTGINTGATSGTQRIDASGNLVNIGTINAAGGNFTVGTNGTIANLIVPVAAESGSTLFTGFLTNELTNWDLRGGTVATSVTGGASIATPTNVIRSNTDGSTTGTVSFASAGTAQWQLTGLTVPTRSDGNFRPFLRLRAGQTPSAVQVEYLNTDGVTWNLVINDTSPVFSAGTWVGPLASYAGQPIKGYRITLTYASTGISYVKEIGLFHRNTPFGEYKFAELANNNNFYGNINITNSGVLQVAGTTVITAARVLQNVTADTGILTSGTLGVARGGTGVTTTPSNGQLLIGNGASYTVGTLGTTGLTATTGAGTLSLAVNYGSGANQAAAGANNIICPSASGNASLSGAGNTIAVGTGGTCNAISLSNTPSFTSITATGSGPSIIASGAPSASATSSLFQGGSAIAGGSANGTLYGGNIATTADLLNLQVSGVSKLLVTTAGNITAGTYNTNTFTGNTLTFGTAGTATIAAATNQNLTLQAPGTGSLTLTSGSGTTFMSGETTRSLTRTLPTVVNDAVDLGAFTFTNGAGSLDITVTVPSGGYSESKTYILPVYYNQTNNVWTIAQPISSTGIYSGNDFDLDVNVFNGSTSLRLRRTAGSTAGTANVTIKQQGVASDTFTASTATSTVAAPTTYLSSAIISQSGGAASIQGSLNIANSGSLAIGATTVITSALVLQNVTADTGILTSGTLGVARGGTGAGTFTSNGILYGNGTGALQATAAGTTGQCLVGNTSAAPSWASCASGITLQSAYANSVGGTTPNIAVSTTKGAISIQNSVTNPITGNLLEVRAAAANDSTLGAVQFAVTNTGNATLAGTLTASSTSNSVFGNGTTGGIQIGDGTLTKASGSGFTFNSTVSAVTGFKIGGGAAATGNYLRGDGTNFVSSSIQATDVPTLNQNTTGYSGFLRAEDNRVISPSEGTASQLKFGFTSFNNDNASPYADFLHMRSYTDGTGGNDNLVVFRKDIIGARIYQQTFGSASVYSSYKDFALQSDAVTFSTITSTVATGTAPLTVASTTKVTNLNADLLDGLDSAAFCQTGTGCSATGTAGGDLSGSYPNPTVAKINGVSLGATTATAGNLLLGSGSQWVSQAVTGDITIGSTGITAIGANKVTNAQLRTSAATSIIGRSANTSGNVADISASADGQVLRRISGVLGFGTLDNSSLSSGNYTNITGVGTLGSLAISGGNLTLTGGRITQSGYNVDTGGTNNLLVNGDFEYNRVDGWTGLGSIVAGGYAGNYTSQTVNSSTVESEDFIPVDPTKDVLQLEGWFKKTVTGSTPGVLYFGYKAYDASKAVIGTAPCGSFCYFAASATTIPADSAWHKYSSTSTGEGTAFPNFPVNTKYVRVVVLLNYSSAGGETTLMDHVTLKRINHGPLFVGNNYSSSNLVDQNQVSQIYTTSGNVLTVSPPSSGAVNIANSATLQTNGTTRLDGSGNLSNIGTIGASGLATLSGGALIQSATDSSLSINRTGGTTTNWNYVNLQASGTRTSYFGTENSTGNFIIAVDTANKGIQLTPNGTGIVNVSTSLNAVAGINTGASSGTQRIDGSGNHVNAGNYTGTGAVNVQATTGTLGLIATGANIITATTNGTERLRIDSGGNVGIGTTQPSALLDVRGTSFRDSQTTGLKTFTTTFPNAVANQKVDIYLSGTQSFWGSIDVTVEDGYNNQNASGGLTKRFYLGLNPANAVYSNEARYTDEGGATADNYAISDLRWDATNSRYYITIVHRVSTGNSPIIHFQATSSGSAFIDNFMNFAIGAVYTTDATVYNRPYVTFNNNVGIGTANPGAYRLNVQGGDVNFSGNLAIGTTTVITSARVLQNVTADTGILTSGTLGVARGGTGAGTFTQYGIIYGNGTGALQVTAVGATGQCLIGNTSAAPTWGACTAGNTLQTAYTNSTNPEITLDSTRGALTVRDNASPIAGNLLEVQNSGGGTTYLGVSTSGTSVTGTLAVSSTSTFTGHIAVGSGASINQSRRDIDDILQASSKAIINVRETYTDTTGYDLAGSDVDVTFNPASAASITFMTGQRTVARTSPGNIQNFSGNLVGAWNGAIHSGTGTIPASFGAFNFAYNNSTGTLTNAYGTYGLTSNRSTGTINSAYGGLFAVQNTSTGTIGGGYGVMIASAANSGTFQNNYGLYIQDQSAVGTLANFNLYSAGANSTNYFGGNVGIGTAANAALFDVAQATTGPGTVATAGTTTLTGTRTQFINTFKVGDTITVSGETVRTITAIASNVSLTVSVAFSTTASNLTYTLTGGNRLTVLGNGNVGIGYATPGAKFEVRGSSAGLTTFEVNGEDTSTGLIARFRRPSSSESDLIVGAINNTTSVISSELDLALATGQSGPGLGTTRVTIQNSTGNFGIGDTSPAALLTVGNGDLFKVDSSGYIQGNSTATATTGTTEATARTNVTTVTLTAAGSFANNDVIFINNAGQDYYTRIVSGGGTTTLTVSPAVSYDASASVTEYTTQSLGATSTDYTTLSNRMFQGYFLGGVVTGAGSTIYSDGNIASSTGLTVRNTVNSTTAFQVQNSSGASLLNVNAATSVIGLSGKVSIGDVGTTPSSLAFLNVQGDVTTYGAMVVQGTTTGVANRAFLSFVDSAGTRKGYIGDANNSNNDIYLESDSGDVAIINAGVTTAKFAADHTFTVYEPGTATGSLSITSPGAQPGISVSTNGGLRRDFAVTETGIRLGASADGNAPTAFLTLDSSGTIVASNDIVSQGNVIANGTNSAVYYKYATPVSGTTTCRGATSPFIIGHCTSLQKYKDNTQNLSIGIETLRQLRPVEFDWNIASAGYAHDLGFIAEEVNAINPLLSEYSDGKLSGVKYNLMASLITKSIQQLDYQVQSQQAAINSSDSKNQTQDASISNLDARVLSVEQQLMNDNFSDINVSGNASTYNLTVTHVATIKDLVVTGDAVVDGNLTVTGLTNVGEITVNGHIISRGNAPTLAVGVAAGTSTINQPAPAATVDGTDNAGTVSVMSGTTVNTAGVLAEITFANAYATGTNFKVALTPTNDKSLDLRIYVEKTATGFRIVSRDKLATTSTYNFDYIVIGSQQTPANP